MMNLIGGNGTHSQLAYVTTDLDRAISSFASSFGVTEWMRARDARFEVGAGLEAHCHVALAESGGVQLEIIEPVDGAVDTYRTALEGSRFKVAHHHVAYWLTNEAEFEAAKAEYVRQGIDLPIDGSGEWSRYFYADTREQLGYHIEYSLYRAEVFDQLIASVPKN